MSDRNPHPSMRILLVSFVEDNRWTGMGKWSHAMAASLRELGHEPTLWFADDFPGLRRMGRSAVLAFPAALSRRIRTQRAEYDVVVVHEASAVGYAMSRQMDRSLPPLVVMCHNVESRHFRDMVEASRLGLAEVGVGSRIKAPLARLWQSDTSIRLADHVCCLSSTDRSYITGELGVASQTVSCAANGVVMEDFAGRRDYAGGRRVLFVGGWLDVKGKMVLPRLWDATLGERPDATLTLLGTGKAQEDVLRDFSPSARESIGVIPRIEDPRDMVEQFRAHDILLMPSLSEGSPLALLEAMAAGTPVVASSVGGIPDVVVHGEHGLLFDATHPTLGVAALARLMSDRNTSARIGNAARERVSHFTWLASAQKMAAAAERALTESRGRKATGAASTP